MALETGLAGKVAVVTGALGNLGSVWSSALAEAGMLVVGVDVAAPPDDHPARTMRADVTDRSALEEVRTGVSR